MRIVLGLVMLVFVLFLSAFAAGASPMVVALGMLGVGVGFAFKAATGRFGHVFDRRLLDKRL